MKLHQCYLQIEMKQSLASFLVLIWAIQHKTQSPGEDLWKLYKCEFDIY